MKIWDELTAPIDLNLSMERTSGGLEPKSKHPRRPKHVIFSPPQNWAIRKALTESGTRRLKKQMYALLHKIMVRAGSIVYHNKRATKRAKHEFFLAMKHEDKYADGHKGIWHWLKCLSRLDDERYTHIGPHFHCILYGWLPKSNELYESTKTIQTKGEGWVYDNRGKLAKDDDIRRCLAYQLGHSAVVVRPDVEGRRKYAFNAISYIGELYYTKVQLVKNEKNVVICPECGERVIEWIGWTQGNDYSKDRVDDEFVYNWNSDNSDRPPKPLQNEIMYTTFTYEGQLKKYPDVVVTIIEDNNPLKANIRSKEDICKDIHEGHAFDHGSGQWIDENGQVFKWDKLVKVGGSTE